MLDYGRVMVLLAALEREGVEYVVVGAVALAAHGLPRGTEDVDIFVKPDPENIEALRRALRSVWSDPAIEQIMAEDLAGDYPTVRYGPPNEELTVDILSRLGDAFAYDDLETERVEVDGVTITVVTPKMLYRMKRDTLRSQDRADADWLRREFKLSEE